jgi:hypothetical protein
MNRANESWLVRLKRLVAGAPKPDVHDTGADEQQSLLPTIEECCSPEVNIAYRGLSDDRLYMAYGRQRGEVKFYKPNGLRVFCARCRKRLHLPDTEPA